MSSGMVPPLLCDPHKDMNGSRTDRSPDFHREFLALSATAWDVAVKACLVDFSTCSVLISPVRALPTRRRRLGSCKADLDLQTAGIGINAENVF